MRIIAALPLDSGCFRKLKHSPKWQYRWEYDNSDRIRVYANVPDPWSKGQQWEIKISEIKGNSNTDPNHQGTIRIYLECYPIEQNLDRAAIVIEEQVYGIAHSTKPTIRYYPIRGDRLWVKLSVLSV